MLTYSKQNTQKRMLSRPNQLNSPRLVNIGSRSPSNTNILSPTSKSNKLVYKSFQPGKHQQIQFSQSKQSVQQKNKQIKTQNNFIQRQQIQFDNGDYYKGSIKDNKYYGKGQYYFNSNKILYQGQFSDNNFHGWGVIKKINNKNQQIIYQGNLFYNQKHGNGKYMYQGQKIYYNGQWRNDKKQGKGIYFFNQNFYNGQWKNNKKNGQGILKLNNGIQYRGLFENDIFINGLIKYNNGDQYSGTINPKGQRHGQGSYFCLSTQQRYKGQWINDKKHGRGTIYLPNKDQLNFNFNNGQIDFNQSGTYKWNSGPDTGTIFNGWFKNGNPQKGHIIKANGQQFDIY